MYQYKAINYVSQLKLISEEKMQLMSVCSLKVLIITSRTEREASKKEAVISNSSFLTYIHAYSKNVYFWLC